MDHPIDRRDFLKATPAAAALIAAGARSAHQEARVKPGYPIIGSQPYTPVADYPIRAKRFSEVTLTDDFWKPKTLLNATVTIPGQAGVGDPSDRLRGNVLEAAIYSLQTHPDPALQSQVEARVEALKQSMQQRQRLSNNGFEIAATWYNATGKRTLLDPAISMAAALYDDFRVNNPPFSGGERDAVNCLQLYRVTHAKK